jgi:hypothetical protein
MCNISEKSLQEKAVPADKVINAVVSVSYKRINGLVSKTLIEYKKRNTEIV